MCQHYLVFLHAESRMPVVIEMIRESFETSEDKEEMLAEQFWNCAVWMALHRGKKNMSNADIPRRFENMAFLQPMKSLAEDLFEEEKRTLKKAEFPDVIHKIAELLRLGA